MSAARIVFATLVAATFGAFFVAQRLKNSPSAIQSVTHNDLFSPNRDGRHDRLRLNFKLKEADDVSVTILDDDGDPVRELLDDAAIEAYSPLDPSLSWDGRDDGGRPAPDGRYRIRLTLRRQGRSVVLPRSIVKDTRPPRPVIEAIGPDAGRRPELLPRPGGGVARVHFGPALDNPRMRVFRLAPGRPRAVFTRAVQPGATKWEWDGASHGRRLAPGTYLVVAEWRDKAGNIGTSVALDDAGLPVVRNGGFPGRGGITIRYLAVQPPSAPVKAREIARFGIDARRRSYTWSIRRIGTPRPVKRGSGTRPIVSVKAPGGVSGLYLFEVRTRTRRTRVPFAVQARRPQAGARGRPGGVLVVLPWLTWQGRNAIDDDGDGAPNELDLGAPARIDRVFAGGGLPAGLPTREAPLLGWLDRTGRRYDLTTDVALAGRGAPRLANYRGVLLPGDSRWLPGRVRAALRRFVRGGGTVVSLGVDSLRRTVAIEAGRMVRTSPPLRTELFGARLRPLARQETDLEIFSDEIELFAATGGKIAQVAEWEETAAVGLEADQVATAVTADTDPPGKTVVLAARFGRGLVIRPGFPSFSTRLTPDPAVSELMARMWTLLSR